MVSNRVTCFASSSNVLFPLLSRESFGGSQFRRSSCLKDSCPQTPFMLYVEPCSGQVGHFVACVSSLKPLHVYVYVPRDCSASRSRGVTCACGEPHIVGGIRHHARVATPCLPCMFSSLVLGYQQPLRVQQPSSFQQIWTQPSIGRAHLIAGARGPYRVLQQK